MYGNGVYMAECASKADEYGRDDGGNTYPGLLALLVCRCFVGVPYIVDKAGDHVNAAKGHRHHFDCVLGDRESAVGTYREFVFFNEQQVYPEYAIIYRRQWLADRVPEPMRCKTSGTTGRFWQMRGDIFGFKGWKNVPTEVNNVLLKLAKSGGQARVIRMRGNDFVFDVTAKTVTDSEGKSSPLRPPMHQH